MLNHVLHKFHCLIRELPTKRGGWKSKCLLGVVDLVHLVVSIRGLLDLQDFHLFVEWKNKVRDTQAGSCLERYVSRGSSRSSCLSALKAELLLA